MSSFMEDVEKGIYHFNRYIDFSAESLEFIAYNVLGPVIIGTSRASQSNRGKFLTTLAVRDFLSEGFSDDGVNLRNLHRIFHYCPDNAPPEGCVMAEADDYKTALKNHRKTISDYISELEDEEYIGLFEEYEHYGEFEGEDDEETPECP
ncbi:MAG: hypothetical protein RDV48_21765 [Candidatus Eremiobacteraeota bacterium]|nr:hypothetical protein [Candidatus Eremiobacteraeota bacterium]